jgi:hypothetical protein
MSTVLPPLLTLLLAYANHPTAEMPQALRPLLHHARLNQILANWRTDVKRVDRCTWSSHWQRTSAIRNVSSPAK